VFVTPRFDVYKAVSAVIQQIFKRYGTHLPRQTMWDLLVRLDELVAQPVLKQMRDELLEERALQTDETPIRVQREGEKGTSQGWLWSWRNVRGSPVQKVVADFLMDRSADGSMRLPRCGSLSARSDLT